MTKLGLTLLLPLVFANTHTNAKGYVLTKQDTRIIDTSNSCVNFTTVVPADFTSMQLDKTSYDCSDIECKNVNRGSGVQKYPITKEHLGDAIRVTAQICDIQQFGWLGFDIAHVMTHGRQAFHTVHFSQGGNWTKVKTQCIQPQLGSPINMIKGETRVTCAVKTACAGSALSIYDAKGEICRTYGTQICERSDIDDFTSGFSVNVGKTTGERYSFLFCRIMDEYIEFIVDWEGETQECA